MPDRKSSLLILVSIAMSITLTGCLGGSTDNQGGPSGGGREITELEKIEVREYEGKDLSSITDFRENSIDGPQYVDSDTYSMTVGGLVDTPLELTYDEVIDRDRYSKVVQLDCVEGWSVDILWEGVLVRDILEQALGLQVDQVGRGDRGLQRHLVPRLLGEPRLLQRCRVGQRVSRVVLS
jgi:hypothetical protein